MGSCVAVVVAAIVDVASNYCCSDGLVLLLCLCNVFCMFSCFV